MVALLAAAVFILFLLIIALGWALSGLIRQNGRILIRLEAIESGAAADASPSRAGRVFADRSLAASRINRNGLTPGTAAPPFRLPTVGGREAALSDYAGRRVLLVFSDPGCVPCTKLLSRLDAAARVSSTDVLVISRGGLDANRRKIAETGVQLTVALQAHWEISRSYAMFSTPIAYLIDEQGRIAAEVACGAAAVLSLLGSGDPDPRLARLPPGSRVAH